MSELTSALRKKFKTPREALKALGLDEALLDQETSPMKPTRIGAFTLSLIAGQVAPMLAMDQKLQLTTAPFAALTTKNLKEKREELLATVRKGLDGKLRKGLALDASMEHVGKVMDNVAGLFEGEKGADESVSEPQHKAMEAAAHGKSTLGIPKAVGEEFAKADEGKDDLFMKKAMDWFGANGMDASGFVEHMKGGTAEDEEEEAEEDNEGEKTVEQGKAGKDGRFGKDKRGGKDKGMGKDGQIVLTKQALDQAMDARDKATADKVRAEMREEARDMRNAESLCKAKCGTFDALAFDSAESMKRHALKVLGNKHWEKTHATALDALLDAYPDAGAKAPLRLAADGAPRSKGFSAGSDAVKAAQEIAPGLKNIKIGA